MSPETSGTARFHTDFGPGRIPAEFAYTATVDETVYLVADTEYGDDDMNDTLGISGEG